VGTGTAVNKGLTLHEQCVVGRGGVLHDVQIPSLAPISEESGGLGPDHVYTARKTH
jgi:hypothetical protein